MQTVTDPQATRKPRAFYAHLCEDSGVLSKVNDALVFFGGNGAITTVEPSMITFLTVLGEVGIADGQRIMDVVVHGGYAQIACSREEGRA